MLNILIIAIILLIVTWLYLNSKKKKDSMNGSQLLSQPRINNKENNTIINKMADSKKKEPDLPKQLERDATVYFSWNRSFKYDVVGESFYQNNLLTLAGAKEEKSKFIEVVACLKREPTNKHDPHAVVVKIKGMTVAYLSKSDARAFARALKNNEIHENSFVYVRAVIVGGWSSKNGDGDFGVKIDMPEFSKLKYCISDLSFDDADKNLKNIPLTTEQKQQLKILNLKPEKGEVTYFDFDQYINQKSNGIKNKDPELYEKWSVFADDVMLKTEIYEFWSDKDELESFFIKKPSKTDLNKAIDNLLGQGKTLEELIDDPDFMYEELINRNPDLER